MPFKAIQFTWQQSSITEHCFSQLFFYEWSIFLFYVFGFVKDFCHCISHFIRPSCHQIMLHLCSFLSSSPLWCLKSKSVIVFSFIKNVRQWPWSNVVQNPQQMNHTFSGTLYAVFSHVLKATEWIVHPEYTYNQKKSK